MSEPRAVLLLQCLCPARHTILAFAGDAPPATPESIAEQAKAGIEAAIAAGKVNPWCELCKAHREHWTFEVATLPGRTLAEMMPELQRHEAAQMQLQAAIKAGDRASRN